MTYMCETDQYQNKTKHKLSVILEKYSKLKYNLLDTEVPQ